MKKLFLEFSQHRYQIIPLDVGQNAEIIGLYIDKESKECKPIPVFSRYIFKNNVLDVLFLALQPILGIDIETDGMPKSNEVFMWPRFSIKKQEYKDFLTIEEFSKYNRLYEEYYDKRWEEVPKLKISMQDWEQLQQQWKQIKKELPHYLIFTLDDSGPTDKIEIMGKNELSQEDIQEIQIEHEKYLKHQSARQKYMQNHPDYSDIWRGPQDDEYEADIMKYYEN